MATCVTSGRYFVADRLPVGAVELRIVEVLARAAPALVEHLGEFLVAADRHLGREGNAWSDSPPEAEAGP